jgi:hypothetical protein
MDGAIKGELALADTYVGRHVPRHSIELAYILARKHCSANWFLSSLHVSYIDRIYMQANPSVSRFASLKWLLPTLPIPLLMSSYSKLSQPAFLITLIEVMLLSSELSFMYLATAFKLRACALWTVPQWSVSGCLIG